MNNFDKSDYLEKHHTAAALSEKEYRLIRDLVYKRFGINLTEQKKSLIVGRLNSLIRKMGFKTFEEYFNYLTKEPTGKALGVFIDKISTNHTFFYRENDHFDYFNIQVLPFIESQLRNSPNKEVRLWVAGCSSGEEPYFLAMLMKEYFKPKPARYNIRILATDIATSALETAIKGVYNDENVSKLPPKFKNSYFDRSPEKKWVVKPEIKNMILYRRLNLMREKYPFKNKFHTIFCRNVMIYFDKPTREKLINRFYANIEEGGYLFIGHSETIDRKTSPFSYIKPAVYRKEGKR